MPDAHRSPELDDVIDWLGETIRQTDSSLLDEWQALTDPEHAPRDATEHTASGTRVKAGVPVALAAVLRPFATG